MEKQDDAQAYQKARDATNKAYRVLEHLLDTRGELKTIVTEMRNLQTNIFEHDVAFPKDILECLRDWELRIGELAK